MTLQTLIKAVQAKGYFVQFYPATAGRFADGRHIGGNPEDSVTVRSPVAYGSWSCETEAGSKRLLRDILRNG